SQAGLPAPVVAGRKSRERLAWLLAASFLLLALASLAISFRRSPGPPQTIRAFIPAPEGTVFDFRGGSAGPATLSPDGSQLAFTASNRQGETFLWVRRLDTSSATRLAGTEGASYPFWSPDSRFLGFFAEGKLKTIEASGSGGLPQALADILEGRGGTWNREGVILFSPSSNDRLYRVSATGGKAVAVTTLDESAQERHRWPLFLPDGRHFLYLARFSQPEKNAIYAGSLDSRQKGLILRADSSVAYAPPGYLLFRRERKLLAAPFDAKRLAITGEPLTVAEEIEHFAPTGSGVFSASETGVLAYAEQDPGGLAQLQWFDRRGKQVGSVSGPGEYQNPRLSADGKRLAVTVIGRHGAAIPDIWLYDLPRAIATRFTFAETLADFNANWSPNGGQIVFNSNRKGPWDLYQKAVGGGESVALLESKKNKFPSDWSSDGRFILYREFDPKRRGDLWVLPLFGDRKPIPLLTTEFDEGHGQFSPDGQSIAYTSNESAHNEVYVMSFPGGKDRHQISAAGGSQPRWRQDGGELFYIAADKNLMAVEVQGSGAAFTAGEPRPLFETHLRRSGSLALDLAFNYDVAADGQRFLMNVDLTGATSPPIALVVNWTAGLKK
ncbi:MAG: TolB family protein, partial [Thermoanaerobaculia bacterium]